MLNFGQKPQIPIRSPDPFQLLNSFGRSVAVLPGIPIALGSTSIGSSMHATALTITDCGGVTWLSKPRSGTAPRCIGQICRLHGIIRWIFEIFYSAVGHQNKSARQIQLPDPYSRCAVTLVTSGTWATFRLMRLLPRLRMLRLRRIR